MFFEQWMKLQGGVVTEFVVGEVYATKFFQAKQSWEFKFHHQNKVDVQVSLYQ